MPNAICQAQVNLWATLLSTGQLKQSSVVVDAAAETASRFGLVLQQRWIRGCRALDTFDRGNWNDAQVLADELLADVEAGSPHYSAPTLYAIRALIRIARDDVAGALADTEQATNLARLVKDPQILYATLAIAAHVSQETRNLERAAVLADELLSALRTGGESGGATDAFHMLAWTLSALGRRQELIDVLPTYDVPWVHAELCCDACDDAVTLAVVLDRLEDHPDRPLPELRRVPACRGVLGCFHGSIFSKWWSLQLPQSGSA